MAIQGLNTTNYSGEVLEQILTLSTTTNELVEKGLIMVIPGVHKAVSIPRIKSGKMLQKHKEDPQRSDSKGDFKYSEQKLSPNDMMAFTVFNPRSFEYIWRTFQPKGNLLFGELPSHVQSTLLGEVFKQVTTELGWLYINGVYEEGTNDELLLDGILTQAAKVNGVIKVQTSATTMLGRLKELRRAIPVPLRRNPNLRILMSVNDFDTYDDELTARESKNKAETEVNEQRYKNIKIEVLSDWPDGIMVSTPCSSGVNGNLFAAVNLQDDENVIQVDKLSAPSELYFIKMLMKADTNIAFGEEFVALDWREGGAFVPEVEEEEEEEEIEG